MKSKNVTIKCIVVGLAAGLINGFFGAGGGMVVVPLMSNWVKMDRRNTFATSLAIVFPLCIVSIAVGAISGTFSAKSSFIYIVGGLIGGFIGGRTYKKVPVQWLHRLMGCLIIYGGIRSII